MMDKFRYDNQKAIHATLFITSTLSGAGFHKIFKILYFADQKHLSRYGRPVVGDYYVAMQHGPVPSKIYDFLKLVKRGEGQGEFKNFFDVQGYKVFPKIEPDLEELSETDLQCLSESISENQNLSFPQLTNKSHDSAYKNADENLDDISFEDMASADGASKEMLTYIRFKMI